MEELKLDLNTEESLFDRVLLSMKDRKQRILDGKINCVPSPFKRFRSELPGVSQGIYYLVSAATKVGKTQITSYLFIFNTIFYMYENPGKLRCKFFYYNLEETEDRIFLRFMSYCLYSLSKGRIRISTSELMSTDAQYPVSDSIMNILQSPEYKALFSIFENVVSFQPDRNPTGVWKTVNQYAQSHGTLEKTTTTVKDEFGNDKKVTKYGKYTPNDPDEYVFIIVDHVSLLENERGMNKMETINKLSEYMVIFRNRYNYSPIVVQQQNMETTNLEAIKASRIRPTKDGLKDSKRTGEDCNVMIGLCNPYSFEMGTYMGYDIKRLQKNARFLEIVVNRDGEANSICPLFFDGMTCNFAELPLPNDTMNLSKVYNFIDNGMTMGASSSPVFMLKNKLKKLNFIKLWQ